ncbi:MAG: hypothetical protein KAS69_07740 [Planctomycetes bacterium]|nr:hypothetical protein [Planctomycetota bacterium]
MKIAFISAFPPSRYNIGAPMSLPYQLLKYKPSNYEVDLYYYGITKTVHKNTCLNDISQLPLNNIIEIKPYPKWKQKLRSIYINKLPRGVVRFYANRKILKAVNKNNYDAIWLYPLWLITWAKRLNCQNIIVTAPDSVTLHSERYIRGGNWQTSDKLAREVKHLIKNVNLEKQWSHTKVKIHFVGENDVIKYNEVTKTKGQAFWTRHPISGCRTVLQPLNTIKSKISVLISGGWNPTYVGTILDRMIHSLLELDKRKELSKWYKFTFLGSKYGPIIKEMTSAGFEINHLEWADNYYEELSKHNIQLFPIAVGSGTKGKVLNAMASGLLAIGTELAFENIDACENKEYICLKDFGKTSSILLQVAKNKKLFADMALNGMNAVRKNHSPVLCAQMFWDNCLSTQTRV